MKTFKWLVLFLLIGGCDQNRPPEGILNPEKMSQVLLDIYVIEGKVTETGVGSDSARKVYRYFEQKVFDEHGINDTIFRRSFNYYLDHPKVLSTIYSTMLDSLNIYNQKSPPRPE